MKWGCVGSPEYTPVFANVVTVLVSVQLTYVMRVFKPFYPTTQKEGHVFRVFVCMYIIIMFVLFWASSVNSLSRELFMNTKSVKNSIFGSKQLLTAKLWSKSNWFYRMRCLWIRFVHEVINKNKRIPMFGRKSLKSHLHHAISLIALIYRRDLLQYIQRSKDKST